MAVFVYRLRSGQVQSFSRFAYGIENNTLIPALPTPGGGKRRFYFKDVRPESYPILMTGGSAQEIADYLNRASGVRFTISGTPDEEEDDLDSMLKRELERRTGAYSHRSKHSMEGMRIYFKWQVHRPTDRAIEIHDAAADAFKGVALTFGGIAGSGMASVFSTATTAAPTSAVSIVKDLSGTAPDVYDIGTMLKGDRGDTSARIGLMIHYLPLRGGHDTGRTSVAAKTLARLVMAR